MAGTRVISARAKDRLKLVVAALVAVVILGAIFYTLSLVVG